MYGAQCAPYILDFHMRGNHEGSLPSYGRAANSTVTG
jgi:hypothetical protein